MDLETYFKIEDLMKEVVFEGRNLDPEKQVNRFKGLEMLESLKERLEVSPQHN